MVRSSLRGTWAIGALGLLAAVGPGVRVIRMAPTEDAPPTPDEMPSEFATPPKREAVPERLRYVPPAQTGYDIHKIGAKTLARMAKAKARKKETD